MLGISLILYIWIKKSAVQLVVIQCTCFAPSKGIQDILGLWIPCSGVRIAITGFQSLSVELGFWIPIVSWIPDSYNCIPDYKAQDSEFHKQKFPGFRNPYSLMWGKAVNIVCCSGRDMFNNISYLWDRVFPLISSQAKILFKGAVLVQHTPRITEVVVILN